MRVLSTLPRTISEVIPTISGWSLAEPPPPLYYEPLEKLQARRPKPKYELFDNIPDKMESLFSSKDTEARHYGMVAVSILLLGHEYVDECHDIVLSLSWSSDMDIMYRGTSEFDQATKSVRAFASYVHCMVHRKEAIHVGEFGMVGIDNAKFWSNQVIQSGGEQDLPQDELRERIHALAKERQADSRVGEWCSKILKKGKCVDHKAIHDLAMTVLRQQGRDVGPGEENLLRDFAEQVNLSELRILLAHSLKRAGFEVDRERLEL